MSTLPQALVFDLDGTLAESKQRMSTEMGDLLAGLLEHMPIAVMSGGSWLQFQYQFFSGFPGHTAHLERLYLFPTHAGMCFVNRLAQWHPQYDRSFSAHEKKKITDAFEAAFKDTGWRQPEHIWGLQFEDRGAEITFSALGGQAPAQERERWDPARAKRGPLYEALKRRLPEYSIVLSPATSIDVIPHGVNKGYGVTRFAELTRIAVRDMLYVGDALEEGGDDAAVLGTGIPTHEVFGPEETAALLRGLMSKLGKKPIIHTAPSS